MNNDFANVAADNSFEKDLAELALAEIGAANANALAALAYREAIKFDPENPEYHDKYANCLINLYIDTHNENIGKKSFEVLQEAIKLFPENYKLQYHLGCAFYFQDNFSEAKKFMEQAESMFEVAYRKLEQGPAKYQLSADWVPFRHEMGEYLAEIEDKLTASSTQSTAPAVSIS